MPADPPTKTDLLERFATFRGDGLGFWRAIDPADFWTRPGGAWSPADNVRHLTISAAPVARALRIPRVILRALFGMATRPSRTWHALRSAYLDRLAKGGSAGPYAPPPVAPPADRAAGQRRLIDECEATTKPLRGSRQTPRGHRRRGRRRTPRGRSRIRPARYSSRGGSPRKTSERSWRRHGPER